VSFTEFGFIIFVSNSVIVICRGEPDAVLSELFTRLWDCDINRCEPDRHYTLDLQGNAIVLLLVTLVYNQ